MYRNFDGLSKRELQLTAQGIHFLVAFILLFLASWLAVAAAQTPTIIPAPSRDQKSWIVGRSNSTYWTEPSNSNLVGVPKCTDFCLNVPDARGNQTVLGLSVQMFPCHDSDDALFQYDESSGAISMWDPEYNVDRCFDAGEYPSTIFTMQACNASAPSQQWYFLQSGQLKSGLINTSAGWQGYRELYLGARTRRAEDWGKGWNNFELFLTSGSDDYVATASSFSLVQYVSQGLVSQRMLPLSTKPSSEDLIINGDFERCGYDPGQGQADFSGSVWWFGICSWMISSGSVQLVRSSNPQIGPTGGNNFTLHLNGYGGPGSVSQLVSTEVGSNYSLTFDFGDANPSCGSAAKTMNVSISPSYLPEVSYSTNGSDSGRFPAAVTWARIGPLNFTASGQYINVTFSSTTDGACGPVIDNVSVEMFPNGILESHEGKNNAHLIRIVVKIVVSMCGIGFLFSVIFCARWMWRRKRRAEMGVIFSKGIRYSSDTEAWDGGIGSRSSSFSGICYDNQYSWEQLKAATSNFANELVMGDAKTVLYFAEFSDGLLGAVKVDVKQQHHHHQRHWSSNEAFKQEVALLQGLHHTYLLNLIGVCIGEGTERALVFEYMPNGTLFDRLHGAEHSKHPLSWQVRMVIAYQVACALEYLHEEANPPIIHLNVQASNVLLQRDDSAKLAAFDVSRSGRPCASSAFGTMGEGSTFSKGSSGSLDPARRTGRVSKKTDVYSYGALLLDIITGCPAAELDSRLWADAFTQSEQVLKLVDPKLLGMFNEHELLQVIDVAVKCLKPDPKSRPSMSDVVFMLRAGFS